ncbi:hypothetical protein GLX27_001459 [Malassezia furfur]|uniref:Uncharacterized protein n=1 Tax=Malassezia furfur TaxID=55194 RepID=A0ABY8EPM6_MALFU|nr:hypothetical protein GLX27_001459 [Malassezia furfur]
MTLFHALCAINQLLQDTSPSSPRLLLDFVGQDYSTSKLHLLCIDGVLWFFHMILLTIAVEEAKCRIDPHRRNPLDVEATDESAHEMNSPPYRDSEEEDVHERLLPSDTASTHTERVVEDLEDIVPTTRAPIAQVHWSSLWTTEPGASFA